MSTAFKLLSERSDLHRENNDCTVKCLALMLGTSYEDAWNKCTKNGRKVKRGFDLPGMMERICLEHGLTAINVGRRAKTIKSFQRLRLAGRYVIHTTKHILYYENGVVHDWSDNRELRIIQVWKITGDVNPETIDPDCDTLSHSFYTRRELAKPTRTRKSSYCWKLVRMDTGETVQLYKRKPTAKIESLVQGRLTLRSAPKVRLAIMEIKKFGGKRRECYESPEDGRVNFNKPVAKMIL